MHRIGIVLAATLGVTAAAQSPAPSPLADTRLTVHTLLREDIFAGILDNDMDRLALILHSSFLGFSVGRPPALALISLLPPGLAQ